MRTFATALAAAACLVGPPKLAKASELEYKALPKFGVAAGASFPLGSLFDPGGNAITAERLLGKPVLINFYTKYCAPCIKEVPQLNRIMERRSDVNVLAMTPDGRADAAKYVKQHGLSWPVAADASELLFTRLNVESFPGFALLDAKGRLLATVYANQLGGDDGHATVEGIEAWLNAQLRKAAK